MHQTQSWHDGQVVLHHDDCLTVLSEDELGYDYRLGYAPPRIPDASVDSVVTDPPYGLANTDPSHVADTITRWVNGERDYLPGGAGFMGKAWDAFVPPVAVWDECLRVLKPGGHVLTFAGSRTMDLMTLGLRLAGFDIRDSIAWLYGSGFSKGGLMGNKAGLTWCDCGPNALPYNHAPNTDLPRVRQDVHPPAVARSEGQDAVLLAPVQRGSEGSGVGQARPQGAGGMDPRGGGVRGGEDARGTQPGMGGRFLPGAGQGLPHGAEAGSPEGQGERLRGRAPAGHGGDDRSPGHAAGGSAPHQPGPGGQPTGEPEALPGSHEPLDDGARRGRVGCPRCGGLDPAFRGFSTTLKPAFEPIVVARKPLTGTVAQTVLQHGTGALNIDGCRVEGIVGTRSSGGFNSGGNSTVYGDSAGVRDREYTAGRWPTNVLLDDTQAAELDRQSGERTSGYMKPETDRSTRQGDAYGVFSARTATETYGDTGGASRFFPTFRYEPKAPTSERPRYKREGEGESRVIEGASGKVRECRQCGNRTIRSGETEPACGHGDFAFVPTKDRGDFVAHPTVKPLDLMRWLVRLVTPPGGTVLEPFAGSGTTVEACIVEGFRCVAIEREADYLPLIEQRIHRRVDPIAYITNAGDDLGLFDFDEATA